MALRQWVVTHELKSGVHNPILPAITSAYH